PSSHRLRVWRLGYEAAVVPDIAVRAGRSTRVVVELVALPLPQGGLEVIGTAFTSPRDRHGSSRTITREQLRRLPGAMGHPVRAIQSLPGTGVSSGLRNDMIARGGNPGENLVLVNGFELPSPSHFTAQGTTGGALSMIPAGLVSDLSFISA